MVNIGCSIQCSDCRKVMAIAKFSLRLAGKVKPFSFLLPLLNTELCTLNSALAKDCGTHGVIYAIEEQDPIQVIQQKLKNMEDSGELKRRNLELQKKAKTSIERPKPVEGMTKSIKSRIFFYDPTYIVKEDLKDHQGRIFAQKGTKINPLETVHLSQNLIFFDGDDGEQLAWVQERLIKSMKAHSLRLILIKGAPLKLAEELGTPVYFDQGGTLTKKLGIRHVPAVVSQKNLQLQIEEIELSPSRELLVEGEQ